MNKENPLLYFNVLFICIAFIYWLGYGWGTFCCLLFLVGLIVLIKLLELIPYSKRFENIYLVSNHPDGRGVEIPGLQKYITCVDHSNVLLEVKRTHRLLKRSKNKHYNDPSLKEWQKLKVIYVIFQDGHPNESWDDFTERVSTIISNDRDKRHGVLKAKNSKWYMKYANKQSGVYEWEKDN